MTSQTPTQTWTSIFWRPVMPTGEPQLQANYKFASRFRLLEPLGRGGFGQVWRAEDVLLEQEVALKVSRSDLTTETRVLRRLPKDRYVAIFDYVLDESFGSCAYSMELLESEWMTLEDYRNKYLESQFTKRAAVVDAVRLSLCITIDILASLRSLHGAKYGKNDRWVHGDIKPNNVYINREGAKRAFEQNTESGRPFTKIGDLGLAGEAGTALVGFMPGYAPPEQEDHKAITPAADLFAVGQTLAYLVLGRPFEKDELKHVKRMKEAFSSHIHSAYIVAQVVNVVRTLTKATPFLRGNAEEASHRLRDIFKTPEEWQILSVFMSRRPAALTLNEAVERSFEGLRASKGWKNLTAERRAELSKLFRGMYKRKILKRNGQRYTLRA